MREQTPDAHAEMEEKLIQFYRSRPPAADFTDRLEQRLLKRAKKLKNGERNIPTRWLDSRLFKVAVSIALVLTVLFTAYAVSPPLRSWAQEIVRRVGDLIITDAPTDSERRLPALQTTSPTLGPEVEIESLTQEEASRQSGFTVLVPQNLPKWESVLIYSLPGKAYINGFIDRRYEVRIEQFLLDDQQEKELPVSDAEITEISVRGQKGFWIEEAPTNLMGIGPTLDDLTWHMREEDVVVWEENDIIYIIYADTELSRSEMLEIAESLVP